MPWQQESSVLCNSNDPRVGDEPFEFANTIDQNVEVKRKKNRFKSPPFDIAIRFEFNFILKKAVSKIKWPSCFAIFSDLSIFYFDWTLEAIALLRSICFSVKNFLNHTMTWMASSIDANTNGEKIKLLIFFSIFFSLQRFQGKNWKSFWMKKKCFPSPDDLSSVEQRIRKNILFWSFTSIKIKHARTVISDWSASNVVIVLQLILLLAYWNNTKGHPYRLQLMAKLGHIICAYTHSYKLHQIDSNRKCWRQQRQRAKETETHQFQYILCPLSKWKFKACNL